MVKKLSAEWLELIVERIDPTSDAILLDLTLP
jgi:hypothetical protein